jgi:16S rRNA (guanine527-N7)-methyltransferase
LPHALENPRARGFLGPQALGPQVLHAEGFALCWEAIRAAPPDSFLDLGSGGGLPGLVLLDRWRCRAVFLDSMNKRSNFLSDVVNWSDSPEGEVVTARAEEAARRPEFDGVFDLVTARSFGPPAVTAECAVRFLKVGGALVVSEPPDDAETGRWKPSGLGQLGLTDLGRTRQGSAFRVLVKERVTAQRFPRESGIPKKLPLF